MHTEDGNIVHQCLSGNTELFALLVDKYKGASLRWCTQKLANFKTRRILLRMSFSKRIRNCQHCGGGIVFYPWLYSIASNQCKNYHYDRKRRVDMTLFDDPADIHQADMAAHAEKLRNEQIHEALASLPRSTVKYWCSVTWLA